jgi:ribonuclease P protein component
MLKRQYRLVTDFEYNVVRRHGKKIQSPSFQLFYIIPHNYVGNCKVGIVVSTKFDKSAVVRNRVKRIFSEVIRLNIGIIKDNYWLVIHPSLESLNRSHEDLSVEFITVLQKMGITK